MWSPPGFFECLSTSVGDALLQGQELHLGCLSLKWSILTYSKHWIDSCLVELIAGSPNVDSYHHRHLLGFLTLRKPYPFKAWCKYPFLQTPFTVETQ